MYSEYWPLLFLKLWRIVLLLAEWNTSNLYNKTWPLSSLNPSSGRIFTGTTAIIIRRRRVHWWILGIVRWSVLFGEYYAVDEIIQVEKKAKERRTLVSLLLLLWGYLTSHSKPQQQSLIIFYLWYVWRYNSRGNSATTAQHEKKKKKTWKANQRSTTTRQSQCTRSMDKV